MAENSKAHDLDGVMDRLYDARALILAARELVSGETKSDTELSAARVLSHAADVVFDSINDIDAAQLRMRQTNPHP